MSSTHLPPHSAVRPRSEAELVARATRGDAQAFGDLYEFYLDALYRYLYFRCGDPCEAEDLTEMVFLKAWEALGRYDADELNFRALLYRIAHNLVVDRHRTRRQESSLEEAAGPAIEGPEPALIAHESQARLAEALARLDPAQQQVVTLRFVMGLSHSETGRIVGKSDGAVRVLQHRALAALRALLKKDGADGR